ncbi:MAG: DUF1192 domain-containing protein [Hyphomicrobiaceae bacterium]
MDWDDSAPKKPAAITVGEPLANLSVADLEARIAALGAEIERVKAELARKKAHSAAASELFKGSN